MQIGHVCAGTADKRATLPIGAQEEGELYQAPLPSETFGEGTYITFSTHQKIVFTEICSARVEAESIVAIDNLGSSLKFTFQLQTQASEVQLENQPGWTPYLPGASHTLSPLVHTGRLKVEAGQRLQQSTLFVPKDEVVALLEDHERPIPFELEALIHRPASAPLLISRAITPEVRLLFHDIHRCPMRGSLRRVYLEAKITELALVRLCEEVRRWDRDKQRLPVKLTEKDLCKIRDAAEILHTRLQCPPSLHELGTLVGLNVNKLKYGFRFVYGTSVFGYLHSLRLRQAFMLLRDTELNVTEVAEQIGYSRQSSFSVAFRREFGFPPQKVKA